MEQPFDEFMTEFYRVAPSDAKIWAEGEVFQANVAAADGHSYTVSAPFDPGIRTVKAHAAGLAERLWDFLEGHEAARRIRELEASRREEDLNMMHLYVKARRHGFLPDRDPVQEISDILRVSKLSPGQADEITKAVRGRVRVWRTADAA